MSEAPVGAYPPRDPLTLDEVRALLADAPFKWWIAGGWALDLFLGRETREHSDVDVAVFRDDQQAIPPYLGNWSFEYVDMRAGTRRQWQGVRLELPIHEIWARPRDAAAWQLEFLLNERDGDAWVYRRDARIQLPLAHFERFVHDGLPFLPPEVVLLFKSNRLDRKSTADFEAAVDSLDSRARDWLDAALATTSGEHPWLASIRDA